MKTIRIDDEVYEELQRRARGFETRNTVVRRVLGLDGDGPQRRAKDARTQADPSSNPDDA